MPLVLFNPKIGPLSGATTPAQSGPRSNGNKGVLCIPRTSPSDCLVSYPGRSLGGVLPLCRVAVGVFYSRLGKKNSENCRLKLMTVLYIQILNNKFSHNCKIKTEFLPHNI